MQRYFKNFKNFDEIVTVFDVNVTVLGLLLQRASSTMVRLLVGDFLNHDCPLRCEICMLTNLPSQHLSAPSPRSLHNVLCYTAFARLYVKFWDRNLSGSITCVACVGAPAGPRREVHRSSALSSRRELHTPTRSSLY